MYMLGVLSRATNTLPGRYLASVNRSKLPTIPRLFSQPAAEEIDVEGRPGASL